MFAGRDPRGHLDGDFEPQRPPVRADVVEFLDWQPSHPHFDFVGMSDFLHGQLQRMRRDALRKRDQARYGRTRRNDAKRHGRGEGRFHPVQLHRQETGRLQVREIGAHLLISRPVSGMPARSDVGHVPKRTAHGDAQMMQPGVGGKIFGIHRNRCETSPARCQRFGVARIGDAPDNHRKFTGISPCAVQAHIQGFTMRRLTNHPRGCLRHAVHSPWPPMFSRASTWKSSL